MRVPNINTYFTATYRLGKLTEDLKNANEVVSTQKRINEISDDPLGLSQVLSLRNSIGNLKQIQTNVTMGKTWLKGLESSLDSVNDLILQAKTDVLRLANDSTTHDERLNAGERINNIIELMVTLGNTRINGNYIFGGTDTATLPFRYDQSGGQVLYLGNTTPFEIRTDKNAGVEVGRVGSNTFWDTTIDINTTNNTIVFSEDNGHGSASRKIIEVKIPDGVYTREKLTTAVRNALNEGSQSKGYGARYEVAYNEDSRQFSIREDGSFNGYLRTEFMWATGGEPHINTIKTSSLIDPDDVNISVLNRDALTLGTPEPFGTKPFKLVWDGSSGWNVEGNPGYVMPWKISGTADSIDIDLDESGFPDIVIRLDRPVVQQGESIEFEIVPYKGDHGVGHEIGFKTGDLTYSPPVSDANPVFITDLTILAGVNDTIAFQEVNATGGVSATLSATLSAGNYKDMNALALEIETRLEAASLGANTINYTVSYDSEASRFNIREDGTGLNELRLLWSNAPGASATAETLGYYPMDDVITYPISDIFPIHGAITIDHTNNRIDFRERGSDGKMSDEISIQITQGNYTDLNAVAADIQAALRTASPNQVQYTAAYDFAAGQFMIKGSGKDITGFDLLWQSGTHASDSAAHMLGFDQSSDDTVRFSESDRKIINLVIDGSNNKIDFKEITKGSLGLIVSNLTASIRPKTYTSYAELAGQVEIALEAESLKNGNKIDYSVSWDDYTRRFTIKEKGTRLEEFHLQWETGEHAPLSVGGSGKSIGTILGFNPSDDIETPLKSNSQTSWGIFNTLIDLKKYLADNDRDGIERSIGRLELNFDNMTSRIVDVGMKYNRLEVRETITTEVRLSLTERRSMIEDADIIESLMNLKNLETAYQAALTSTSKMLGLSLVDYMR